MLSGGMDKLIRLWDVQSQTLVNERKAHNGGVFSLSVEFNNNTYYSVGSDKILLTHDVREREPIERTTLNCEPTSVCSNNEQK